jgi:hypothetical protein
MSNWRKHTNSSQIEVYSVELDCNTNRCHNETPSGHDEAETETARNKKKQAYRLGQMNVRIKLVRVCKMHG